MLIMGFGPRRPKDLGPVAPALCPNCGNHVVFRLIETKNWFSVFFVPLVPGRAHHLVVCPICHYSIELDPASLRSARALLEMTNDGVATRDPTAHRRAVDDFWQQLGGERLADAGDAQSTESAPSSERPDASPPDPATAVAGPPAGWYADPFGESEQRYWDGQQWTAGTNPPVFRG